MSVRVDYVAPTADEQARIEFAVAKVNYHQAALALRRAAQALPVLPAGVEGEYVEDGYVRYETIEACGEGDRFSHAISSSGWDAFTEDGCAAWVCAEDGKVYAVPSETDWC